jgi:5-methylcytosine-specific restriction protein B
MAEAKLGAALKRAIAAAKPGDKATAIHLFGIMFADQLKVSAIDEVVKLAGLQKSWGTEVRKGIKLAQYVDPKA